MGAVTAATTAAPRTLSAAASARIFAANRELSAARARLASAVRSAAGGSYPPRIAELVELLAGPPGAPVSNLTPAQVNAMADLVDFAADMAAELG